MPIDEFKLVDFSLSSIDEQTIRELQQEYAMGMRGGGGEEMVVTVKTETLIAKLTENKVKHVEEYKKASEVYRKKLGEEFTGFKGELEKYLGQIADNKELEKLGYPPRLGSNLPRPVNYEDHYNRALGMLRLHSKDEMTLDMASYRKYVEDDWEWSSAAATSNRGYLGG